jgi:putative nucleotidyltransferase with HDIG domain/PAS domain S-box-containing protein
MILRLRRLMPTPLSPILRVLDVLPCGALLIDRRGRIVHANQKLDDLHGRALGGTDLAELYAGTDMQATIREELERFEEPREVETFFPRVDGSRRTVMVNGALLGAEEPLTDYRLVTVTDVTAIRQAEEDTRAQYRYITEISNTVIEQALDLKHYSARLEEKVRDRTRQLHEAHLEAIYMLAVASEAKDEDTGHHVRRIQKYAHALARKMGIPEADAEAIGYAAILHDVGKFHVPDAILQKAGPLTPEERARMQEHTLSGERIIADSMFFTRARQIARSHHENWDGSGYPDRMSGDAIPLEARIVHVVDVYDALTNKRAYKAAWTPQQALEELKKGSGRMFEPELVEALEAVLGEGMPLDRMMVTTG